MMNVERGSASLKHRLRGVILPHHILAMVAASVAPSTTVAQTPRATNIPVVRLTEVARLDASDWIEDSRDAVASITEDGRLIAFGSSAKGTLAVRMVDNGRTVTIGRPGSGPGELQQVGVLGWRGATLSVFDPALRRVSSFTTNGTLLSDSPSGGVLLVAHRAEDSQAIGIPAVELGEPVPGRADSANVGLSLNGKFIPSFRVPRRSGGMLEVRLAAGGVLRVRHPAGPVRDWVFAPDGSEVCWTEVAGPLVKQSVSFVITCRAATASSARWTQQLQLQTFDVSQSWANSVADSFVTEAKLPRSVATSMSTEIRKRAFVSPVSRAVSAGSGTVWVQLRSTRNALELIRVGRTGAPLRLTLGEGTQLLAARGPWLITAHEDDEGAVELVLWRAPA